MGIRPHCLCLTLIAALGAGGTSLTADPLPSGGVLALSSGSVSTIPIDADVLAPTLCRPENTASTAHLVRCTITVINAYPGITVSLPVGPLTTFCGLWYGKMTVNLAHFPISSTSVSGDSSSGGFSGALAMSTSLHFTNPDTGRTVDLPLQLGSGPAGPMVPVSPDASRPAGSMIFFETGEEEDILKSSFENCIPAWFVEEFPLYKNIGDACPVCPDPMSVCADNDDGNESEDGCHSDQVAP